MARDLRISIGACSSFTHENASNPAASALEGAAHSVRLAAAEGAELVVLPETIVASHCSDWTEHAEPLDGYLISSLSQLARECDIAIAAGHATVESGKKYNSLVLLDRRGERIACYHKAYPTIWEMERGIALGEGALVSETEFGRIGFAICYDLNFAELRLAYRDLNPDLILFASMFRGGLQTRWWAYETRSYLVSSVVDPKSLIVNPLGRVVAETDTWSRSVTRTINLDYEVVHLDYTNKNLLQARLKYGADFDFDWSDAEGVLLVTARGERSARELISEYGWETVEEYFARSRRVRDDALAGRALPAGPSPW
jgi:predicted amidohydrolase